MRRLAIALLLAAACAVMMAMATPGPCRDIRDSRDIRDVRVCSSHKNTPAYAPLFSLSTPSTQQAVRDVCTANASLLAGNYICTRGDGGAVTSGQSWTATGSPTYVNNWGSTCPNGTTCAPTDWMDYAGAQRFTSGNYTNDAGTSFSACVLWNTVETGANKTVMAKQASSNSWEVRHQGWNAAPYMQVFGGSTTTLFNQLSPCDMNGWQAYCYSYQSAGNGTSTARTYCNGVADTFSTTAQLPNATTTPISLGANATGSGSSSMTGDIRQFIYSESLWSASDVQAVTDSLIGSLSATLSDGGTSRVSVTTPGGWVCPDTDGGSGTMLGVDRVCVNQAGWVIPSTPGNAYYDSEWMDGGDWSLSGFTTATRGDSRCNPDPLGGQQANYVACGTTQCSAGTVQAYNLNTRAPIMGTASVWLRVPTGMDDGGVNPDGGPGTNKCLDFDSDSTQATNSVCLYPGWHRFSYSTLLTSADAGPHADMALGGNGTWLSATTPAICVFGAQANYGTSAGPYVRTKAGATVVDKTIPQPTVTNPLATADQRGWCFKANVSPLTENTAWGSGRTAASNLWLLGTQGTANSLRMYVDTTGALVTESRDPSNNVRKRTSANVPADGPHTLISRTQGSEFFVSLDGVPMEPTQASFGLVGMGDGGISSMPGTFKLPGDFGATYSNVTLDNTPGGCGTMGNTAMLVSDSILGAPAANYGPDVVLRQLKPTWGFYNYATGGQEIPTMQTTQVDYQGKAAGHSRAFVLGGINDAAPSVGNQDAGVIWQRLLSIYADIEDGGTRVIPMTTTPWKGSGGWSQGAQDALDAVKVSQLAWCASTGHTCIDAYTPLSWGADGGDAAKLSPIYDSGDHVHLTDAGITVLGQIMAPALP